MIKALFFDWFNTLADFEPPRYKLYQQFFQKFGVKLSPEDINRGVSIADRYFSEENVKSPVAKRSQQEQMKVYLRYPEAMLAEAEISVPSDVPLKVLQEVEHQFQKGSSFVLFDDVLSALETLKRRNMRLGLLTNATRDTIAVYRKLGLDPYLDFVVTSEEAGAGKPKPTIFLTALDRAEVSATEAVHVGDQYEIDVVGARGVGITPVLIDRYDIYPEITDCSRIRSLSELSQVL